MIASAKKIRCLVVDNPQAEHQALAPILQSDPAITVIDTADSVSAAVEKIRALLPDVVALEMEMLGMAALVVVRELLHCCPVPVVMVSRNATTAAAPLGNEPSTATPPEAGEGHHRQADTTGDVAALLIAKVKQAASDRTASLWNVNLARTLLPHPLLDAAHIIAIGCSTVTPGAMAAIFCDLPEGMPPVLVVHHQPPEQAAELIEKLGCRTAIKTAEATHGQVLGPNTVWFAPHDVHMTVTAPGGQLQLELDQTPAMCGHRPSIDRLFRSMAATCAARCSGVILTGLGKDGVRGLGLIQAAGGQTIAQDPRSDPVFGMSRAAIELGYAHHILPLQRIAAALCERSRLSAHAP